MAKHDYQIVVIGAGAAGLVIATGAARAGKKVLLVDKGTWGGDCTNFGCIPSKSLIGSANVAHEIHHANGMGLRTQLTDFNGHGALERARKVVKAVRSHEEPDALKKIGIATAQGVATFVTPHELRIDGAEVTHVTADQIVVATGSHPIIPNIDGLDKVPYLTNETIFELLAIPKRLIVLGGGPIGCELAQAFARLGSEVTLIQRNTVLLPREELEAQTAVLERFRNEGIKVLFNTYTEKVEGATGAVSLVIRDKVSDATTVVQGCQLLIASGRKPTLENLNLEAAGVSWSPHGVTVDKYGRTSQKHIWAVGDAAGLPMFTHVAENRARAVLTSLILPRPFKKKITTQEIPRVTFTAPEVAACGMREEQAIAKFGRKKVATYTVPLAKNDRAITAGVTDGFVKVVTRKWSSRILGATIVGPRAGEMLPELTLAMHHKIPLRKLSALIHPYPTYSGAIRNCADQWLLKTLLRAFTK